MEYNEILNTLAAASAETTPVTEQTETEVPKADIKTTSQIMLKGMATIMLVMFVLYLMVKLLNYLTNKKPISKFFNKLLQNVKAKRAAKKEQKAK